MFHWSLEDFIHRERKKKKNKEERERDCCSDWFKHVGIVDEQDERDDHYVHVSIESDPLVSPEYFQYKFHP